MERLAKAGVDFHSLLRRYLFELEAWNLRTREVSFWPRAEWPWSYRFLHFDTKLVVAGLEGAGDTRRPHFSCDWRVEDASTQGPKSHRLKREQD